MSTNTQPIELEIAEPAELATVVKQTAISVPEAQLLNASFSPLFSRTREVLTQSRAVVVTDCSQVAQMKVSREYRLELKRIRVEGDKVRKTLKEDSLRRGKAIDGFFAILSDLIGGEEKRLEDQEKFAERMEAAKKEERRANRSAILAPFRVDVTCYDLAGMSDETFAQLLDGTKLAAEAKAEAARKAEAERIAREQAEAAERERIRQENERLKREAAEREEAARIERERVAKEKADAEAKARAEREAIEAKARAEREAAEAAAREERRKADEAARIAAEKARKEREAIEAKAKAERDAAEAKAREERAAREKVERELAAEKKAEEDRKQAEAEAARRAAAAPDREKLMAFAESIRALKVPEMTSANGQDAVGVIDRNVRRLAEFIEGKAGAL